MDEYSLLLPEGVSLEALEAGQDADQDEGDE